MLAPSFVAGVLDSAMTFQPDGVALDAERARLVREIGNLTAGIAEGGDIPALVALLEDRDQELKLPVPQLAPRQTPDREPLRLALEQRVVEWRGIRRASPRPAGWCCYS